MLKSNLKRTLFSLLASAVVVLVQVIGFKIKFSYLENNTGAFGLTLVESLLYDMGDKIWIYHGVVFILAFMYMFYLLKGLRK